MDNVRNKENMTYAPIALFTYNRADHTKKAVESLLQNAEAKDSELFVFSDGAKNEKAVEGVKKNRKYIHEVKKLEGIAFKNVTIIEREKNWGLAKSLIAGITELTDKYGRVIVVEDDLILSPYFLQFMNNALDKYEDDDRVGAISAYLNPIDSKAPETFFLRYFACWGWAVWKRSWNLLNTDSRELLRQLRWKKRDFDIDNSGPFYGLLYCQKLGLVDSWAVLFYASLFLKNKYVLYPGISCTQIGGVDGSGTHSGNNQDMFNVTMSNRSICLDDIPVMEDSVMYDAFARFNSKWLHQPVMRKQFELFKSFVRRVIGLDYK